MPELPDIEAYLHALRPRLLGSALERVSIAAPFVLRSVEPPIEALEGRTVSGLRRLGKRVVLEFSSDERLFLVVHLMVAGRFQWKAPGVRPPARITLARLQFPTGSLVLTEAGTRRRASMHAARGEEGLRAHDPGGLELFDPGASATNLAGVLRRENRMLKRALTDPRTISGIGNAYADEILLEARLSPILLTSKLSDEAAAVLFETSRSVLSRWTRTLCERFERRFPGPGDVTAFRPEFGAHGRFGKPCPRCGPPPVAIQRIVHAENETNYCPRCQTGGRILADRSLSRLLKDHWPRTIDDLE
ncbi:MAG: Fpg/Nei family DNA glycosylase [Phycisphaerales bacterium]